MKKILTLLALSSVVIFVSCNSKTEGATSDKAKTNLEASRAITKMFENCDFSKIGDYIAADAVDHAAEGGPSKGLEAITADLKKHCEMMSNNKSETIKELADDDFVMIYMRHTGTLKQDMMGMKAGETITATSIELSKYKDGKAIEHWTFMEPGEVMKMMGGMQPPVADTTKPK